MLNALEDPFLPNPFAPTEAPLVKISNESIIDNLNEVIDELREEIAATEEEARRYHKAMIKLNDEVLYMRDSLNKMSADNRRLCEENALLKLQVPRSALLDIQQFTQAACGNSLTGDAVQQQSSIPPASPGQPPKSIPGLIERQIGKSYSKDDVNRISQAFLNDLRSHQMAQAKNAFQSAVQSGLESGISWLPTEYFPDGTKI